MQRTALLVLTLALVAALLPLAEARAQAGHRTLRFSGRLQMLSGAGLALPSDFSGSLSFAAYVPIDLELSIRLSGPLSLSMGGIGFLAPFHAPACAGGDARPNALSAALGVRFDLSNSRDGSWLNPWLALRAGLVGQNGIAAGEPCIERFGLGLWLGPRAGLDIWMGRAAATFALGYDYLPRTSAISVLFGLTLRLF